MGAPTTEQRRKMAMVLGGLVAGFAIMIGLLMWGAHELFEHIAETIR